MFAATTLSAGSTLIYLESSTMSDAGIEKGRSYNESEIMLASSHPKKPNGRKKFKETRHPVYRGVRRRNSNRWVCEVREPNKKNRIWLGTYPTAEMAARAHDVAAIALRGMKSCLNFADSAWRLPVPASSEQEDIQRAAAEAAEMFRPEEYDEENINMDKTTITIDEDASSGSNTNVTNYQAYNGDGIMNETNWYTQPLPQPQPHPQQESSYYSMQHPPQPQPQRQPQQESSYYFDEEAIFDMPGLLHSMAEGLLLPPPSFMDSDQATCENAENNDNYVNLWNH